MRPATCSPASCCVGVPPMRSTRRSAFSPDLLEEVPVGGLGVGPGAPDQDAELQPELLPLFDNDPALLAPGEGVPAEGVGLQQSVVSDVEPAAAEVAGVGHEEDAGPLTVGLAAVGTPVGPLAPDLGLIDSALAVGDPAPLDDRQRRSNTDAEAHLLLVAEDEIAACGPELRVPHDQVAGGPDQDRDPADLLADGCAGLPVAIADGKGPPTEPALWFLDEAGVPDAVLVAPGVGPVEVTEGQPEAGVVGRVVRQVHSFDGRVIPRHLSAVRGMDRLEERSGDRLGPVDVAGERPAADRDLEPIRLSFEGDHRPTCLGRLSRPAGPDEKHKKEESPRASHAVDSDRWSDRHGKAHRRAPVVVHNANTHKTTQWLT